MMCDTEVPDNIQGRVYSQSSCLKICFFFLRDESILCTRVTAV